MNTKSLLITALATAFAGAAFADVKPRAELNQAVQMYAPSALTRAEVTAEFLAARANGTLIGRHEYDVQDFTSPAESQLTRAEVTAEFLAARANGTLIGRHEYDVQEFTSPVESQLTRAEVLAASGSQRQLQADH